MSTQSFKFPATIPIDITFFNAESVSPSKLNNIFNYIKNAAYSIEMFLGNGVDYDIVLNANKKLTGNISNIIGITAGNVYIPHNRIDIIYSLYKKYCSTYLNVGNIKYNTYENASYNKDGDYLEILSEVNIPVMRKFDNAAVIGIHYCVTAEFELVEDSDYIECVVYTNIITDNGIDGDKQSDEVIYLVDTTRTKKVYRNDIPHHSSINIPAGRFIRYIGLKNKASDIYSFKVHSLYISEYLSSDDDEELLISGKLPKTLDFSNDLDSNPYITLQSDMGSVPLNHFYSIGLDHKVFMACMKPCKWSKSSYNINGVLCDKFSDEGSCIGNTYDIYIDNGENIDSKLGIPVCAGTYRAQSSSYIIDDDLLPSNGVTDIQYDNSYDGEESPQFLTMQSPLSLYRNKFGTFKYHPFMISYKSDGQPLEQGRIMIYDALATNGNHVVWDAKLISTLRSDIVRVITSKMTSGNVNKYLTLSGDVGLSDMIGYHVNESNTKLEKNVAVYSD